MAKAQKKIKLKGHETFTLREGWMNKAFYAISENAHLFSENSGADALGVGTNMAKAIRYWMRESGFMEEPRLQGAQLTALGKLIYKNDPYLEDVFALWIFHVNFVAHVEKATSWYVFFNELSAETFKKDELYLLLHQLIAVHAEGETISTRSLSDDCNAILHMYVRERMKDYDPEDKKISPFAQLGLVKKDGDFYQKVQPDTEKLSEYVVLYLIQRIFEKDRRGISIDDLLQLPNLPGKVLNLKRVALNEYLDVLDGQGTILVNRTAGLDMVYPNSTLTSLQVVEKYYETLNRWR